MKVNNDIRINGKLYKVGSKIPSLLIFPFFLIHMLIFGGSGFAMAYFGEVDTIFLYMHGGFAIFVYLIFYLVIFGLDAVKWMFINATLGIFGIYSELRIVLRQFDKEIADFPWTVHVVPFTYYVLYTFLIYQAVLSFTGSHGNPKKKRTVEIAYIAISTIIYFIIYLNG